MEALGFKKGFHVSPLYLETKAIHAELHGEKHLDYALALVVASPCTWKPKPSIAGREAS
jgi:hypothetical protein